MKQRDENEPFFIAKSDDADSTPPLGFDGVFHGIDDELIFKLLI
jgi:hypothetical protein